MIRKVEIEKFLKLSETIPVIDVRSPGEYQKAHIPVAINLPLFTNEERAEVGIIYKKQSKEKAILKGLEIVGPKMRYFAEQAKKISLNKRILVHCWRGGMRSENMSWLFDTIGLEAIVLIGGYKSYRKYLKEYLSKKSEILILSGYTGSGKTDILYELKEKYNQQILDLEGLANHKGSAFGAIGEKPQKETEMFENMLFNEYYKLDLSKKIWIEDESKAIGKNFIPDEFYSLMRKAPVVKIIMPKNIRIKRLIKEYTNTEKEILVYHIKRIEKRLGYNNAKMAINAVLDNNLEKAVDIVLIFYDKAYDYGLSKRKESKIMEINLERDNPSENAKIILDFIKNQQ